jgi:hypothetical protein
VGNLVAKAYPTRLVFGLADHTYVECGNGGHGWKCFGGKTGGHAIRTATGSTSRADAIATPTEHSGLACYAVNGVCHQAANRILLAAQITVEGARGYGVSHAMFGVYGRVGIWPCSSIFHKHEGVAGDLPACRGQSGDASSSLSAADREDGEYVRSTLAIYDAHAGLFAAGAEPSLDATDGRHDDVAAFHLELFGNMVDFKLGPDAREGSLRPRLLDIRRGIEERQQNVERRHAGEDLFGSALADEVDAIARDLQDAIAGATTDDQYQRLLGLPKGDVVAVTDREVVEGGEGQASE